jgi:hypothetical protein
MKLLNNKPPFYLWGIVEILGNIKSSLPGYIVILF